MSLRHADDTLAARRRDPQRYWRMRRRERARDCAILVAGAAGVFAILALSGGLGWIEAITACIVVALGALAFFVGSNPAAVAVAEPGDVAATAETDTERQIAAVVDALPLPAFHVASSGALLAINDEARRVFRTQARPGALAASALRKPALLKAIEDVNATARGASIELATGDRGDEVWLAHLARRAGEVGGVLAVLEDRTGIRRSERARADFLANASHELRTPLTSLAGFIETMRGPARDDKESWDRFLDIMFEQTERMRRLISDLLSLSRIEFSEHQAPDRIEDFAAIVRNETEALRPLASEGGVMLVLEAPEQGLPVVASRDEMSQVVQNFVSNALKYSPKGSRVLVACGRADSFDAATAQAGRRWAGAARMTLLSEPAASRGRSVWLRVEDAGPGIAREHLPRLGERFYRVDQSRSREIPGTGLGLAIVKHVMGRHRGGMIVESRPGLGSSFGVWLPEAGQGAGDAAPDPVAAKVSTR